MGYSVLYHGRSTWVYCIHCIYCIYLYIDCEYVARFCIDLCCRDGEVCVADRRVVGGGDHGGDGQQTAAVRGRLGDRPAVQDLPEAGHAQGAQLAGGV